MFYKRLCLALTLTVLLTGCSAISNLLPKSVERNVLSGREGINGPVLAVKVDDTNAAHPQIGLEDADVKNRSMAESGLSGALGLLISDGLPHASDSEQALLQELSALTAKIRVAISIHTDAVSSTQMVRKKFVVKTFRLAGTAPLPVTYEFESDVL